jgi:hypothetical protein
MKTFLADAGSILVFAGVLVTINGLAKAWNRTGAKRVPIRNMVESLKASLLKSLDNQPQTQYVQAATAFLAMIDAMAAVDRSGRPHGGRLAQLEKDVAELQNDLIALGAIVAETKETEEQHRNALIDEINGSIGTLEEELKNTAVVDLRRAIFGGAMIAVGSFFQVLVTLAGSQPVATATATATATHA